MKGFKIIAITHKLIDIDKIGRFHIDADKCEDRLNHLKTSMNLDELMYLSTCNRVEFAFVSEQSITPHFLQSFFKAFNPNWSDDEINWAVKSNVAFEGLQAVRHLFSTASSIDSLVIGEREIITQVRNAYEKSRELGLTGDRIRLIIKHTVESAKAVYTETDIARNPVSVVSLAYRKLRDLDVDLDSRVLIIGAGETNDNLSKYISKHGFSKFAVFNRTFEKAQRLADFLGGKAYPLDELKNYQGGFDLIITCTGSEEPIITKELYTHLLKGETDRKTIIDLAVPSDLEEGVVEENAVHYIGVTTLNEIAEKNKKERSKDLERCWEIIEDHIKSYQETFKLREVEVAMNQIPQQVKDIKKRALEEVFAKDLENLDEEAKAHIEKIVSYFEKKYISLPMKMAKEILVEEISRKK